MDNDTVLDLFDRVMRREAVADPGARMERTGGVVRQTGTPEDWNGVLWSDLDTTTADAGIAAQVRHYSSLGLAFEWKLYSHDRPADLGDRLLAAGFEPEPEEALMVARTDALSSGPGLPEGVRLLRVTDTAGVDLVADVHDEAFGASYAALRQRLHTLFAHSADTVEMVVAMAGDTPVCAARMELHPGTGFAGLWGGGTSPAWRGRGIYRALVAHRARIAADRGYEYLQVDASDDSRPILDRLGFARLSTTTPYVHTV